ncbi:MAG: hypothetical protein U1F58_09095 [Burkholderiales bacterium]
MPSYPMGLISSGPYDFASCNPDDSIWVNDLSDIPNVEKSLIVHAPDGVAWVALDSHTTWTEVAPLQSAGSSEERQVWRRVNLGFVRQPYGFDAEDRSFVNSALGSQGNSDYRGFIGEYPEGRAFQQALDEQDFSLSYREGDRELELPAARLLRGAEWGYDYSGEGDKRSLDVPSRRLIRTLELKWDGHSGWIEASGKLAIVALGEGDNEGLFIRLDVLQRFMTLTRQSAVVQMHVGKMRLGFSSGPMLNHFSYGNFDGKLNVAYAAAELD